MLRLKETLENINFNFPQKVDLSSYIKQIITNDKDCLSTGLFYIPCPNVDKLTTLNDFRCAFLENFNNLPIGYKYSKDIQYPVTISANWVIDIWALNKKYKLNLNSKFNGMYIIISPLNYNHMELLNHFNTIKCSQYKKYL